MHRHFRVRQHLPGYTTEISALLVNLIVAATVGSNYHHVGFCLGDHLKNLSGGVALNEFDFQILAGLQIFFTDRFQVS